ncbi:MAG TPA: antibiotic biosynthesis monooxygenase [Streptosporangiaceae bacterium]|nr:antibiotic biosynthesis monooxygenase [Streptosporangiaceae bacterium]
MTLLRDEPAPVPGEPAAEDGPVTLVLSRQARPGREQEFEQVLRGLAAEVRSQPGHLAVAILAPQAAGPAVYTIVSHFASRAAAQAWLDSPARAQRVAEADLHTAGELQTRYLSGLEGWLARPGRPVMVPPARWRIAIVSAIALLPVLEAVTYLLAPRLAGLPLWARPAVSAVLVIPVMQYAVMPVLTRAARGFLYPARHRSATGN